MIISYQFNCYEKYCVGNITLKSDLTTNSNTLCVGWNYSERENKINDNRRGNYFPSCMFKYNSIREGKENK